MLFLRQKHFFKFPLFTPSSLPVQFTYCNIFGGGNQVCNMVTCTENENAHANDVDQCSTNEDCCGKCDPIFQLFVYCCGGLCVYG